MNRLSTRGRRLLAITCLALLTLSLAVPTALAFEGRTGDTITIAADEVIDDDLYVGAGKFVLDGTVKGDLIVAGGAIEINGTVEGDLWAVGRSIVINGTVGDDVRTSGYAVLVGDEVGDDLIAAGFSLESESGSNVGGDLFFAGYQALLAGNVVGNADLYGGAVEIAGDIEGDADVDVSGDQPAPGMPSEFPFFTTIPPIPSVPAGLTIDEGASIGGNLNYTADTESEIPEGAVAGESTFTRYAPKVALGGEAEAAVPSLVARTGRWFVGQLRRLITLLLVGIALMATVPNWMRRLAGFVQTKPLPSLGWGIVAIAAFVMLMLVLVIATVLLAVVFGVVTLGELAGKFIALGGIVMGAVTFSFNIIWAYVTKIIISLLLGQMVFRFFKSTAAEHNWWPMLLGVFIFFVITAIPLLGWLITLITVLLGLGALWLWGRDWLRARKVA